MSARRPRTERAARDGLRAKSAVKAWARGAVTHADLSLSTRRAAEQAPAQLRDEAIINAATGILAVSRGVAPDAARQQLEDEATRAGVPVAQLAHLIIELSKDEH